MSLPDQKNINFLPDTKEQQIWSLKEFIFIFIAGFIGDLIAHYLAHSWGFGKGLLPYYNDLGLSAPKWLSYNFKSIVYGGLFGGLACVVALIIVNVFYELEKVSEQNK